MTLRMKYLLQIDWETIWQILHKGLEKGKICTQPVPHSLMDKLILSWQ